MSPRSVAETPIHVAPSGDYQLRSREGNGGRDTNRYDEIEDLILNGESRKNMVHGTRGIAQLAAHRLANKHIRNGGGHDQFVFRLSMCYISISLRCSIISVKTVLRIFNGAAWG